MDSLEYAGYSYLVMTRVPGKPLGTLLSVMSNEQVGAVVLKLKEYVAELKQIRNATHSGFAICNSIAGGILDWRIGDSQRKELRFQDEDAFNQCLTCDLSEDIKENALKTHKIKHEIVFTHGNLNPRNIMVDKRGNLTGIVDWECFGWFPEYWEYTKAHFAMRYTIRWLADVIDQVFPAYREELYVENMLSDAVPPW